MQLSPLTGMDAFCGSAFWNTSKTWETEDPDFTLCFENTALAWASCAFLWCFSPLEIFYITQSRDKDIPWNWKNISKLVLIIALAVLSLADIGYTANLDAKSSSVYPADYFTPIIRGVTLVYSGLILYYNRKHGIRSSGLLTLFWFFTFVLGIPKYRTELRLELEQRSASERNQYPFISYMAFLPLTLCMVILNCVADCEPNYLHYTSAKSKDACPELKASFLSKTFFVWFETFAWKGFRKPLETNDLWDLRPDHASDEIVSAYNKYWAQSVRDARRASGTSGESKKATIVPGLIKSFWPSFLFGVCLKLGNDVLIFVSPQILQRLIAFVGSDDPLWKGLLFAVAMLITGMIQTLFLSQYFYRMSLIGMRIRTVLIAVIYKKVGLTFFSAALSGQVDIVTRGAARTFARRVCTLLPPESSYLIPFGFYRGGPLILPALQMSNKARKESTLGEIVNLMSVDANRFMDLMPYLNVIWSGPLQIIVSVYFLWELLGPSVFAGLAVMLFLIPVNGLIAKRSNTLFISQMKLKDKRVKIINEALNGIKILKLYAWEPSFEHKIKEIRDKELKVIMGLAYMLSAMSCTWVVAPFLVSVVTFATYVLVNENNILDVQKVFVALSLFNILQFPLTFLPFMLSEVIQTAVAVKRINKYMNTEDLDPYNVTHEGNDDEQHTRGRGTALLIHAGCFAWGKDESPTLKDINLRVEEGSLVAVVGSVGSGKSSLLCALLGEMDKLSGRVSSKGKVAYIPQLAWILNTTLKENILFGVDENTCRYEKIIDACALKSDIGMLPGGDMTEIGEKGINLSGGQKQRVSLARAVYNDADVYILDDPLSAVDSHVGRHIFDNVIGPRGMLRDKTRILVTHGVTFLPEVDLIIVLKNGTVSETGPYKELVASKGNFAEFLLQHANRESRDDPKEEEFGKMRDDIEMPLGVGVQRELRSHKRKQSESRSDEGSDSRKGSRRGSEDLKNAVPRRHTSKMEESVDKWEHNKYKTIEEEKPETGSVKWHVYAYYFQSIGFIFTVSTIVFYTFKEVFSVGSDMWLSKWTSDTSMYNITSSDYASKRDLYLGIYGALGVGLGIFTMVTQIVPRLACVRGSGALHMGLMRNIFRSPLTFFDKTPTGRLLSRFGKDIDVLDTALPQSLTGATWALFQVLSTLVVISYSTPAIIIVILPIGVMYYFVQRFYIETSRQLKRLESVTRSPIFAHFGESLTGAPSIRAYGLVERFVRESEKRVDFNQRCYYPGLIANRWLGIRLEIVGNFIIFFASLFAVLGRQTISPGLVGLSITYSLQITQKLNWLVQNTADVETNIVSVERIKEYSDTPQEANWENSSEVVDSDWPMNGSVQFFDLQLRYREGLPLVLKGINFSVNCGEKVGIVGRTGAGKSSLTLALFRIIEAASGRILIDGVDISELGLHTLRSRLTIIPQDPVLFSGSLRLNLDPLESFKDEEVWRCLELAHLKTFVKGLAGGLGHEVTEGGDNLSVGQRQLICLARALLRKTQILILDEATASVDLETDNLIQRTIRQEFKDCTILTIAHRLNTIMDSDRVLVLDEGKVVEFQPPSELLQRKTSVFYSMARDAGII